MLKIMWIKRENSETVNLDYTQSIEKKTYVFQDETPSEFNIIFWQQMINKCVYDFKTAKERDEYFDALMNMIGAEEVYLLKL